MHLELPEPCHESWAEMTPQEKGRHCDKCCKVVVDFTNMPTPDVITFIRERKNERVCGRFRPDQVMIPPAPVVRKSVSDRVKQFLAAIFLVFGGALFSGCHEHEKVGKIAVRDPQLAGFTQPDTLKPKNVVPADTTQEKIQPKGKVKCVEPMMGQTVIQGPMLDDDGNPIRDTTAAEPEILLGNAVEPQVPLMGKPSMPK